MLFHEDLAFFRYAIYGDGFVLVFTVSGYDSGRRKTTKIRLHLRNGRLQP